MNDSFLNESGKMDNPGTQRTPLKSATKKVNGRQYFAQPSAKSPVTPVTPVTPLEAAASSVTGNEDSTVSAVISKQENDVLRPSFKCYTALTESDGAKYRPGVWFHGVDRKGSPKDEFICTPLIVKALASDGDNDFGRLLRYQNSLGNWCEWCMPMCMLKGSGEDLRGELLSKGVEIDPDAHRMLNRYIQSSRPALRVVAATKTGWQQGQLLFVLPHQTIGEGLAFFQSEATTPQDFAANGILEDWVSEVGGLCAGNPLLIIAMGAAFAGPLLSHVHRKGGGLHFYGDSSTGKTTLLAAATSIWGEPDIFTRSWRATSNGLESVAALRNDTVLALDEIGEVDPREISNIIYSLANGSGKSRADRSGGTRMTKHWRIMVISSGEVTTGRQMNEGGKSVKSGQEIRLLDLPVARCYGAWDELHGHPDGRSFSDHLQRTANHHFGNAGPEFVRRLLASGEIERLPETLKGITESISTTGGQEGRAAERLAICALGAELAASFSLLPLQPGAAVDAAKELFNKWRENRGTGQSENSKILTALTDFIARYEDTRFSSVGGDEQRTVHDRAGWWDGSGAKRKWLMTGESLKRAVQGYDVERIGRALYEAGWMKQEDKDKERYSKLKRISGKPVRVYIFHIKNDDDSEEPEV